MARTAGDADGARARAVAETHRRQAEAADPAASVWVSANAGTGKTHVLTMRILRLLLAGTPPERILALTYTKAAAAEMSKRVFDQLGRWVTMPEAELSKALTELNGATPTAEQLLRARHLFALAIETPGGLKVQTIHAFCERLLQRFPLEAGIPPNFTILDDTTAEALRREATDAMLAAATRTPGSPLAVALRTAIAHAVDDGFDAVLKDALGHGPWLLAMSRRGAEGVGALYREALGLAADASLDTAEAVLAGVLSRPALEGLREIMQGGSASDQKAAGRIDEALAANGPGGRIQALEALLLTAEGEPRKQPITKKLGDRHPQAPLLLQRAQQDFLAARAMLGKLQLLAAIEALITLADAVMARYDAAKARSAALDFDDLIGKASSLLDAGRGEVDASAAKWVLFKLDGGLDHILVDEAQDTSPTQWVVVQALAEEFFAGTGQREELRTLFAVGDEKQSIYRFQGAEPEMFAQMGRMFAARSREAGLTWRQVPLNVSFRTTAPVLAAVDAVFADAARTPGVADLSGPVAHAVFRVGQAGLVEVWPVEAPEEPAQSDAWQPLDEQPAGSPVSRVAARIADTIKGWLEGGEELASEERKVRAGDILVLVRRRQPFAPVMVAALKARGIAVAGADRLRLGDQIAVQDLLALGDFLTLPEDDLSLAAVLKSPLFGLDEDDLMKIAPLRKGSLWSALLAAAKTDARLQEAAGLLRRWRAEADFMPPYEFFAALLEADDGRMRKRMLSRLGAEAADALDELVNLALAYDEAEPPSLQGFLVWLRAGEREVKRDMEQGRDEVRVMTVHGAKGLEAPIVFLPDTCAGGSAGRAGALLEMAGAAAEAGGGPLQLWPVKGSARVEDVEQARAALAAAELAERNRLLYVAMTRPRDRLYIAGFRGRREPAADCWYNVVTAALADRLAAVTLPGGEVVRRMVGAQTTAAEPARRASDAAIVPVAPPEWARTRPGAEPRLVIPLAPSRLAPLDTDEAGDPLEPRRRPLGEPAMVPPSLSGDDTRFLRGTLTHALLEHLPCLPATGWDKGAEAFLARQGVRLAQGIREGIAREVLSILRDPAYAPLFGPDSQAEVPVVADIARPDGRGPPIRLTGQIDRLARVGRDVLIVDYKTNRPPPRQVADVAEAYLLQLAAYRVAVARIFPGLRVRAAILWTDGPRIMSLPDAVLDAAEQRLWMLDPKRLDA